VTTAVRSFATYLPFVLSLRSPAVLTALGGDPNSARTLPYIPGSALRGALARALGDPGSDGERSSQFRTLVLDGTVRFLNAYPRAGGWRALPAPVSWRMDKTAPPDLTGELTVVDLAAFTAEPTDEGFDWPTEQLAEVPDPFVTLGAVQPIRISPTLGSRVHHQRDRSQGRAWKEERDGREVPHGALFTFEFIEPGQEFEGLIQLRGGDEETCKALAETVKATFGNQILLGRSRRGGYGGHATIQPRELRDREVTGQGIVDRDLDRGAEFTAVLASQYVGRDPVTGQLDPSRLVSELEEALGGQAEVLARRWAFEHVGGFNRKWRLETPQASACAAGSLLVLRARDRIPVADLRAVEDAGLGERRVEGFGRVIFLDQPQRQQILRVSPSTETLAPMREPPELVRFAEERILDAAVARTIEEEAARLARDAKSPLTPALLGRLRNALRASPEAALETLVTWLGPATPEDGRLRRPAMDQLDRCRLSDGKRLADWLLTMAKGEGDAMLENLLRFDMLAQRHHVVSEDSARMHLRRRGPWIRARLVDATLAALARRQRQRRSS
jgi:CRISPR-associated protein Csx10